MTVLAAWNFDNVLEGATVYDDVGNHNGSVVGAVPLIESAISVKARDWDSFTSANRITVSDDDDLEFVNDRTLEIWLTLSGNTGSWQSIIEKGDWNVSSRWGLFIEPTALLTFIISTSNSNYLTSGSASKPTLTTDLYYYITIVWDATAESFTMSVNGNLYGSTISETGTFTGCTNNGYDLWMGAAIESGSPIIPFDGKIHAVRIHDEKLTAKAIYDTYHGADIIEDN